MRDAARPTLLAILALLVILAIGGWLRSRGVGHLLLWDEAMDLCTTRSFAAGGKDYFSNHMWYHPPATKLLFLAARPLEHGFAERSEVIEILIGLSSIAFLFALNRRTYGTSAALLSCASLALLPGAIFYDTWVKSGGLTQLFGLVSIYCFGRRRYALCGLLLGFAFLDKALALYYAMAIAILWLANRETRRRWTIAATIGVIAAATAGWWYLGFSSTVRYFVLALQGEGALTEAWHMPWHFYTGRALNDVGVAGLAASALGIAALVQRLRTDKQDVTAWPLALLGASYIFLTFIPGKVAWVVGPLFAGWATLAGLGADMLIQVMQRATRTPFQARAAQAAVMAALGIAFVATALSRDHETEQIKLERDIWPSANRSRGLAQRLNESVADDQRALVTTFHYLGADYIKVPCPVFAYYLKDIPVLMRRYDLPAEYAITAIRENKLDWALLSPEPGEQERALIRPILQIPGVEAKVLDGAYLLRTTAVYTNAASVTRASSP